MSRKRTGLWAKLRAVIIAVACSATIGAPAIAGYWTVPVDYYRLEHIRFPLSQDVYSSEAWDIPNLAPGPEAHRNDATATLMKSASDTERGYSAEFSGASYLYYLAAIPDSADNRDIASLSFWLKPVSGGENSMLMSSGSSVAGYSLYMWRGRLSFYYWNLSDGRPKSFGALSSRAPLARGWQNIVITQVSDAGPSGPYVALYVDGVLEDVSTFSPQGSGLLGQTLLERRRSSIGSAVQAGWIEASQGEPYQYRRGYTSRESLDGVAPFATAQMSEFRYFGGVEFACSDKTSRNFPADRHDPKSGDRCHVASDVAAFAHDRLEQAGFLARLPLAHDFGDHNFEGLNDANTVGDCSQCPSFTNDPLRQSAAAFSRNRVRYRPGNGPLAIDKVGWPYGVSFWVKVSGAASGFQPLFTSGSATAAGLDIALTNGKIEVAVWEAAGDQPTGLSSYNLGPGWHHIAVSFDGGGVARDKAAASGLKLIIDGSGQGSRALRSRPADVSTGNVTLGGPDPRHGTRDLSGRTSYDATFAGQISEVQVVGMPITFAQARALATRFPNAYRPTITRHPYPYSYRTARGAPNQPGYQYRNPDPTAANAFAKADYTYDSAHLEFDVDWSKPAPRWLDETTRQVTPDCEYVLGGVRDYAADPRTWELEQPSSVYLCFSPAKIDHKAPPFALALHYPRYDRFLFLTVVEPMLPQDILDKLKTYSGGGGVAGLKTHFELNIGRYNMLLQAQMRETPSNQSPNYVSAIYQGAPDLVDKIFAYSPQPTPEQEVTALWGASVASGIAFNYVDQKQLLNDIDIKLSKDR